MGGSDLNDDYYFKTKSLYKLTTQRCTLKQSISSKIDLMDGRYDPYKLKTHGISETPADCINKYEK